MTEVFDVQQGITGELREKLAEYEPQETSDEFRARPVGAVGYDVMIALCDSIDAVHANLERENAELKAELDRVLGEQEEAIQQVLTGEVDGEPPTSMCHYHAQTVEDLLLDMHRRLSGVSELYDVDSDELEGEYTRIIEEFAAKLRLAGDAE